MKKRGGYLSIVLMILFCGSCRDLFPVQVRQGNFHEVRDSMRVDGKRVLILLASGDCNVCKATKDDWAGDKELVEKLNRDYRVWQLEITDEKNALIPQVLRIHPDNDHCRYQYANRILAYRIYRSRGIIVRAAIVGTGSECATPVECISLHVVFFECLFFFRECFAGIISIDLSEHGYGYGSLAERDVSGEDVVGYGTLFHESLSRMAILRLTWG